MLAIHMYINVVRKSCYPIRIYKEDAYVYVQYHDITIASFISYFGGENDM